MFSFWMFHMDVFAGLVHVFGAALLMNELGVPSVFHIWRTRGVFLQSNSPPRGGRGKACFLYGPVWWARASHMSNPVPLDRRADAVQELKVWGRILKSSYRWLGEKRVCERQQWRNGCESCGLARVGRTWNLCKGWEVFDVNSCDWAKVQLFLMWKSSWF